MASKDYLKLCKEAQKKKLKLMKAQEKQIKQIYNDMYLKVSKKLSKVNPNSLSKRYLEELKKAIEKEIRASNNQIKKVVKKNIEKSSELANNVQLDFFMSINEEYGLNMKDTFESMFSKIPKEAMNEILFGKAYKDRAGLSERIWLDTKKFNKDIDYIIAEGIANKKSVYEVAKDLEIYINPKASKDWEWSKVYPNTNKVVDYNAQRLARTSIQHAFQQSQKRSCAKNPYVEKIRWLSSNNSRTCELCNSRDNQLFNIKDVPLDHPNGLCTTIPQIEKSLDEIGEELRSWIDGEANPMLDKWFKKHGEEFAGIKNDIPKETPSKASKDKQTKKPKESNYLQSLINKGVKVNLDSFKNIDKKLFEDNIKQLDYLINKYPKIQEYIKNNPFEFKAETMKDTTNACCRTNLDVNKIGIVVNSKNFNNYKKLFDSAMDTMSRGWHCLKSEDKLTIGTLTHEFGHAIHNLLIREYNNSNIKAFETFKARVIATKSPKKRNELASKYTKNIVTGFNKEIIKIAKEIEPNVNTEISKYGNSSPQEFFAECFANYECGKPNTLGKAMGIFLERNFK